MNEELENKLYQIDPIFFSHAIACKEGKENEMNTCMYFGCECGDGWFEPIKRFTQKIAILNKIGKQYNIKFICDQLKEKWGTFTCYGGMYIISDKDEKNNKEIIDSLNSMFEDAIKTCEKECWNVCEWCGADGGFNGENLITTKGWISRICKKCAKDKEEKETKHYDEIHKVDYVPRITWFHDGYEFLNLYHINGFKYNDIFYNSIIEAFYCEKDKEHKDLYKKIVQNIENKNPNIIEYIANTIYNIFIEESDYNLLKDIVRAKFTSEYDEDIKKELIETKGKLLQNMGHHHNNIFGHCTCKDCKDKEHKDLYAKILMEIRDELIKE